LYTEILSLVITGNFAVLSIMVSCAIKR